ncbi:ExbD/TolR family protein [Acinetobacter pollinis]|jgi:biopolymer transport protein ExbD|uniref:Biopolymer transporter ExbD n=1 Tax=Acinetobacter pollinis TaxID=2605270 RepID=A0ABU6DTZ2_9GAMM|nr:biopolymer transporter ExbD [Acinetobacter pollinis]MBF7689989.1 biopolymer transporter ExbD [Acinetobacter pollinis]MBF7692963.1 biopolymer transporter ExbD [Acinetobacter pollinis]MBF7697460.1 biopolymer transporter ExbD [Acinetobacter pollinis]MBF7699874.1 biopolymer transporter ExbD [Acinetobacter pollinis]MEB5476873.1 biopolymer transporter ExbD [Acinetobacter pollinis]
MRSWSESKKAKPHIELIPMIDVMMFLLVFFVLISLNVIPSQGLKTQLPSATTAQALKPQTKAVVTLLPDTIQLDGQKLTVDQLLQNLKNQKQQGQNLSIIINSDKGVAVEQLVQVMDRLRADGFTSVSLAARKP